MGDIKDVLSNNLNMIGLFGTFSRLSLIYRIFFFRKWFKLRTFSMALMTLAFNSTSRALPLFLKYFMNLAWIKKMIQIENSNPESEGALPLLVLKSETHSNMLSQKFKKSKFLKISFDIRRHSFPTFLSFMVSWTVGSKVCCAKILQKILKISIFDENFRFIKYGIR